jgi:eukaryotic-like serine/threonine-protein kinase
LSEIIDRLRTSLADRYTVERELGQGGMATVYLATDVRHDREVAIKVLNPELAATIGAERFEREIKLAAKLQHPHILGMFDSGSADGLLFYVMPFVKGESVRDRLNREGQLPVDDAIQITLEVADALGYAHAQGIVHRDIKPENILLANGHALVADFGIARAAMEGGGKLTQTGMAIGTPSYMSPEQASGEAVGPSADLYSLGCVLYEMLAGDPPFTGKNPMAIMARHAMDTLPSIRIVRPAVPEEVEEAIFAAMEKSPADRPKTAADFAAIMGMPLGATATRRVNTPRFTAARRVPTGMQPTSPFAPAWWRRPWVIPVALVLAAGVAYGSWKMTSGGRRGIGGVGADSLAKRVAVLYFADASSDHSLRAEADALSEALIRSLSGVPALTVVSRNGVAKFRDADVPKDSIARALKAGTIVVGTVEPEGKSRIRVSTRLFDGSGTDLGGSGRASISVARDSLFTASDAVAEKVSNSLRQLLGNEIRLRESQAGARNMQAWTLLSRAEKIRKDADSLAATDGARASALYAQADSTLLQAEAADKTWIDPVILQGEIAIQRGSLESDKAARGRWLDTAFARATTALTIDAQSARALALRGTVRHMVYRNGLTTDPVARAALLNVAEKDLLEAVQRDPSLATAYARLTYVYYDKKDVPQSLAKARQAYEADAFLSNAQGILLRLFWASHDTEQWSEAAKWCDEGQRRFPGDFNFTLCHLFLLTTPDVKPDIPQAWRLAKQVDSLAPPKLKDFNSHLAQIVVGGVIGRAATAVPQGPERKAMMDSANKVLVRARGDRKTDPSQELIGYEAIMRTLMGEYATAVSLLRQYVALNPDHSFRVGGNVQWWWRELKREPGFEALLSRSK